MPKAITTREAQRDLDDIWTYIARHNVDAAWRFVQLIRETVRKLARMLGMGPARDQDIAPGIRSYPVGKYLILYKVVSSEILVVRVWHGARGFGGAIPKDDEE